MTKVLKKGGKKQAFSVSKLKKSIEKAAKDAGLPNSKIKVLVKEVAEPVIALAKKKRTVKAAALRRAILGRLDRKAKAVSNAWRRYDRKKKR